MKVRLAKIGRPLILFSLMTTSGAVLDDTANAQQQPASSAAPIAGKTTLGVTVAEAQLVAKGWRASKMIRADVYNEKNEKIGIVDDLIVAPDGTLSVAVIDVGGFLGIASHRIAIPVQQFKQIAPKMILTGANKDALKRLPEFEYVNG